MCTDHDCLKSRRRCECWNRRRGGWDRQAEVEEVGDDVGGSRELGDAKRTIARWWPTLEQGEERRSWDRVGGCSVAAETGVKEEGSKKRKEGEDGEQTGRSPAELFVVEQRDLHSHDGPQKQRRAILTALSSSMLISPTPLT
jgi:hypothetical protein